MSFHPYWVVFVLSFLAIGEWESRARRRPLATREERRWVAHSALAFAGFLLIWVLAPVSAVAVAIGAADSPWGLLNQSWIPGPVAWLLAIALLDLSRYAVHYAHHRIPLLWRFHRVHHSDPDLDLSTGLRAHPFESFLNQGTHLLVVACLAPPVGAVVLAECLICFQSLFSHANARLPERVESLLQRFFVTPDVHRIHHSDRANEQDRNFGDLFPWWDRLLGTYLPVPAAGQGGLVPGLRGFQTQRSLGLWFMLRLPFARVGATMPVEEAPVRAEPA